MKTFFKLLGWLALVLILAIGGILASDWTYWKRLSSISVTDVVNNAKNADTLATVSGSPLDDVDIASRSVIAPEGFAAARAYADATNTVALIVFHRGQIVYEHYGQGYGPDTLTDPASMHKTVLALAYGFALDRGDIGSLDEPAATYLPEWQNDPRAAISIKHLLTMTSGLAPFPFSPNPFGPYFKFLLGTDVTSISLEQPAGRAPGEEFSYSNINSQLLGIVLERATSTPYEDYLAKLWPSLAAGDAYALLDSENGIPRTYCCLQTTARGWLQVGRLILGRGRLNGKQLISRDYMDAMLAPSPNNPNYGYQIWLGTTYDERRTYNPEGSFKAYHSEPFLAADMIYLDGFGGQRVYILPSQELVIVRTGEALQDWDDAKLPNAILRGLGLERAPGSA